MLRQLSLSLGVGLLAGCALKGDVRRVELQVAALKEDLSGAEAARKAELDSALALVAALQQALAAQQAYLVQLRGDMRTDLLSVQQQLVTLQELSGQSQQRLTELRSRLEEQAREPVPAIENPTPPPAAGGGGGGGGPPVGPSGNPAGPGPDRMYDLSLQQYRRGSVATARLGLREFLRVFPTHERAPDAMYYVAESFEQAAPDSAAVVYDQLVRTYPKSPRAPSALYKQGVLAEQRGDKTTARNFYARVIAGYPRSPEADLARQNQQRLKP